MFLSAAAPASFLVFEPADGPLKAVARSPQGLVAFDTSGALLVPGSGAPVRMRLTGARQVAPELLDRKPGYSNYLIGSDASKWRTRVPHYEKVRYRSVLPGIDVVYYGTGGKLEYDFIVAPGANANAIQIAFQGAERVRTSDNGDLLVHTAGGTIRHLRPRVYQTVGGRQIEIAGAYKLKTDGRVEFALGRYDRTREVVVDPVVQFAQYVGRGGQDTSVGIAVDGAGNAYIAGQTNSLDLATATAYQPNRNPESDAYVAKLSPNGQLQWVTYYGGSRPESALSIAVDEGGSVYLTGFTYSPDLPVRGPQSEPGGGDFDSFVAKFNTTGNALVWGTYLGGSGNDWARGIAVDAQGGAWVTGWTTSPNFPLQGAYQGGRAGGGEDLFITRVAPNGNSFTYSTYFGAEGRDIGSGIAVDAAGSVYVTGATSSNSLPLVRSAQTRVAGGLDAFVFKLNPARNELLFSTLLGGSAEDFGIGVTPDESGNAYVVGYTQSANFPVTRGSAQGSIGGGSDLFVTKVEGETGTTAYSTFLGGNGDDWAGGIVVDSAGSAYVAGWTNSQTFPVRNAAQTSYSGGDTTSPATQRFDGVAARLSPGGDSLLYSTYFGGRGEDKAYGVALDRSNQVWIAGTTTSANLPSAAGEFSEGGQGTTDAFAARLSSDAAVALLSAQPSALRTTFRLGESTPAPVTVAIRSTAGATQFTAGSNAPWIQVSPATGNAPGNLMIMINPNQLAAGENRAEVMVRSVTGTLTIPVVVNVVVAPVISATTPAMLAIGSADNTITLTGGGFIASSMVEVNEQPAISTYVDAQTLRVTIPPALTRAEGTLRIVVVNADVRSQVYQLRVASDAPTITAAGVVSAATWQAGPVAPGQIVILGGSGFGSDPLINATVAAGNRFATTLGETRVLFDDQAAPVLWLKSGQVAAIVPNSVSGRSATQVSVEFRGRRSAPVSVAVQQAVPGVFTSNNAGNGAVAAINQDGSANGPRNPAERGTVLVLYATGLGAMNPAVEDGALVTGTDSRPQLPVTVVIGGVAAAVEYAGGVPGQVAGLTQLNVRLPVGIPAGDVPVVVFAGNFSSPAAGVTVSVR